MYAPDLPGHGTTDAAKGRVSVADYAAAVGDVLYDLRLRKVDVFGYELGGQVAAELAISRPYQVRRLILWGVPAYSAEERTAMLEQMTAPGAREDGSDVIEAWQRAVQARGRGVSLAALARDFGDLLRTGSEAAKAYAASLEYATHERLLLVRQRTLVLRFRDESWDHAPRVCASPPDASLLEFPGYGQGFPSTAPQVSASVLRGFHDR